MKLRSLFAIFAVSMLAACPSKPDAPTPPDTTVAPPVVDSATAPVTPTEPRFALVVSQDVNDVAGTVSWNGSTVVANVVFTPKKGGPGVPAEYLTLADGKYKVRLKDGEYTACANIAGTSYCLPGTITVPLN